MGTDFDKWAKDSDKDPGRAFVIMEIALHLSYQNYIKKSMEQSSNINNRVVPQKVNDEEML